MPWIINGGPWVRISKVEAMEQPCPHCCKKIPVPPEAWQFLPPWQCSHCAGLFGVGEQGLFRIPAGIEPLWPLFTWLEAKKFGFHAHGKFYVYALCYPSGLPFYVGKGQHERACQHVEETWTLKRSHWSEKHGVIVALADRNESEWYHFLALVPDELTAYRVEQHYIREWGLRCDAGLLTNRTTPRAFDCQEGLPSAPVTICAVASDRSPRSVIHPLLREGGGAGLPLDYQCSICGECILVPLDFVAKVVQCPQCAHFFKPEVAKFRRSQLIEFGVPEDF